MLDGIAFHKCLIQANRSAGVLLISYTLSLVLSSYYFPSFSFFSWPPLYFNFFLFPLVLSIITSPLFSFSLLSVLFTVKFWDTKLCSIISLYYASYPYPRNLLYPFVLILYFLFSLILIFVQENNIIFQHTFVFLLLLLFSQIFTLNFCPRSPPCPRATLVLKLYCTVACLYSLCYSYSDVLLFFSCPLCSRSGTLIF